MFCHQLPYSHCFRHLHTQFKRCVVQLKKYLLNHICYHVPKKSEDLESLVYRDLTRVHRQTSDRQTSDRQTTDRQTSNEDKPPTDICPAQQTSDRDKCPTRHLYKRTSDTFFKECFSISICLHVRPCNLYSSVLILKPNTFLMSSHPGDDNAI